MLIELHEKMSEWNKSVVDFLHPESMITVSLVKSARNLANNNCITIIVLGPHIAFLQKSIVAVADSSVSIK